MPVHVAVAQDGSNAIISAYHLIAALAEHTRRLNVEAKVAARMSAVRDEVLAQIRGDLP